MDTDEISAILQAIDATRRYYIGCFACDRISRSLQYPASLVANLDPENKAGTHWVAIFMPSPKRAFYFDSLGNPPNMCINRYFTDFEYVRFNNFTFQSVLSDDCGYYVIVFLYFISSGLKFEEILTFFINFDDSDMFVRNFVHNLFK
jgi:hypothetical protein